MWELVGNPEDRVSNNEAHFCGDALIELWSHYANQHYLFHELSITLNSRKKIVHSITDTSPNNSDPRFPPNI